MERINKLAAVNFLISGKYLSSLTVSVSPFHNMLLVLITKFPTKISDVKGTKMTCAFL